MFINFSCTLPGVYRYFNFFKRNISLTKVELFIWDFLSIRNFAEKFRSGSFGRVWKLILDRHTCLPGILPLSWLLLLFNFFFFFILSFLLLRCSYYSLVVLIPGTFFKLHLLNSCLQYYVTEPKTSWLCCVPYRSISTATLHWRSFYKEYKMFMIRTVSFK